MPEVSLQHNKPSPKEFICKPKSKQNKTKQPPNSYSWHIQVIKTICSGIGCMAQGQNKM